MDVKPHAMSTSMRVGIATLGEAVAQIEYPAFLHGSERRQSRYVSNVWVPPEHRRKGAAAALMASIVAQADREGLALFVIPGQFGDDGEMMTTDDLSYWYARCFGFVTIQTRPALLMLRLAGAPQMARTLKPNGTVQLVEGHA